VIGLLRIVGLFNAAVWFGATIFFMVGVEPAATSQEMKELLGQKSSAYFSVAIGQLLEARYLHVFVGCSIVSLIHLAAEWLYLGKYPQKLWIGLLIGLWLGGLAQAYAIQPKLKEMHRLQFTRPQQHDAAARAYGAWQIVSRSVNVLLLCGLGLYLWRIGNPADPPRFLSSNKFHS
jgi:hypothetical protein